MHVGGKPCYKANTNLNSGGETSLFEADSAHRRHLRSGADVEEGGEDVEEEERAEGGKFVRGAVLARAPGGEKRFVGASAVGVFIFLCEVV